MTASAVIGQGVSSGSALRRLIAGHPVAVFLGLVFSVSAAVAGVPVLTRRDILPFDLALYDSLGPLLGVALPALSWLRPRAAGRGSGSWRRAV